MAFERKQFLTNSKNHRRVYQKIITVMFQTADHSSFSKLSPASTNVTVTSDNPSCPPRTIPKFHVKLNKLSTANLLLSYPSPEWQYQVERQHGKEIIYCPNPIDPMHGGKDNQYCE